MAIYDIDSLPSSFKEGDIIDCPYSGTIKSIALPKGKYKFELWGAGVNPVGGSGSAGNGITKYKMGGYTVGNFVVSDTVKTLYLVSGGAGTHTVSSGYNGGGIHKSLQFNSGTGALASMVGKSTNGGGATHIAFVSGLLSEIGEDNLSEVVAVAGGCGGPGVSKTDTEVLPFLVAHFPIDNPSYGGGTTGLSPNLSMYYGFGGTQSEGGSGGRFIQGMVAGAGSFGQGGSGYDGAGFSYAHSTLGSITQYASGGGGGLYGGGGATHIFPNQNPTAAGSALASAGGGSGYISNYLEDAATYNPGDSTPDCPVEYDGYIRITVLSAPGKVIKANVNGTWEDCTPMVKVNNAWKDIDKLFVKVNGVWQSVINNVPPSPVVSTFKIENITYTFEEGMTWNDWVLSSKYSKSTSGMNIPSSPTSAGFHGELSSSVEITDNSEAYKSGAGYVCVGWGDSKEEAYWDLLVYTPDIYSLIRKVRSWEIIFPNQEYFIKWA